VAASSGVTILLPWPRNAGLLLGDPQKNIPTLTLWNVGMFILTAQLDLSRKKWRESERRIAPKVLLPERGFKKGGKDTLRQKWVLP
jgi:hypothetical protein